MMTLHFASAPTGAAQGTNVLTGGTGNDLLRASAGGDVLDGGTEVDTVDYSLRPPGVIVNLTTGFGSSAGALDLVTASENAIGGTGADLLVLGHLLAHDVQHS